MDNDTTGLPEINDALLGDVKKLVINVKSPWHRSKLDIKLEDGVILILKDSKLGLKAQNRIRLIPIQMDYRLRNASVVRKAIRDMLTGYASIFYTD